MSDATLYDVVLRQRACRSFASEDIPDEVVRRLLTAATHAPSAENAQPWRFVVVRGAARRARIADLTARAWRGGAAAFEAGRLPPGLHADVDAGATGGLAGAPVLVVVAADTAATPAAALPASIWPAVQNLLLAAGAEGLGSALTTLATAYAGELAAEVGLPDGVVPWAVVPLGRQARPLGAPRRRPLDEVAFAERYGERL